MKSVPRTPMTVVGVVTLTCSGLSLAIAPVAMRKLPRSRLTSTLPSCVVALNWNWLRSSALSGPMASTVPSCSVRAAALPAPVRMRSGDFTAAPTMAAMRALSRTTVTSPCTVLKVPWRGSAAALPGACAIAAAAISRLAPARARATARL